MTGIVIPDGGTIGSTSDTDAISVASDGKITLSQKPTFSQGIANTGTIDAGTIGSAVTGAGLTGGVELWRLNNDILNDDIPLGNSGGEWTIGTGNQSNTGVDTYGTGLVSESNGIFTINENGYFLITINLLAQRVNNVHGKIDIQSSSTSGSGYTVIGKGYALTQGSGQDQANVTVQALIKVTGSSPFNHKYIRFGYDTNDQYMYALGNALYNFTYVIFHKISDV